MAGHNLNIENELQKVDNTIARKEAELAVTVRVIEEAERQLDQASDERAYKRWEDKLNSLRKDKEGLRTELGKLRGEKEGLTRLLRPAKRSREEMEAIAEEAARKEMAKQHRRLGSTVVPSHDLRRIANSRGEEAKASPSEFGLTRQPSNTTVALTLTPAQLRAARDNGVVAHDGQYFLGFCQLKSEKYLVQPLLTQLLEKVVSPYEYCAFDVHDKDTRLFDGKLPDNFICRAESQTTINDIPDLVTVNPQARGAPEEKDAYEAIEGPLEAVQVVDVTHLGITPERIGAIVEAKAYRKIEDPDAHEQILSYMRTFLMRHVGRQHVYGLLTDLQSAYVYRMSREPTQRDRSDDQLHQIAFLGKFSGTEILQVLRQLLSGDGELLDDAPLLLQDPGTATLVEAECVGKLGRGGFGRVLHIKMGGDDYALKVPTQNGRPQPSAYSVEEELAMTLEVVKKCLHVPTFVQRVQARNRCLLLMKPVGMPHSKCRWTRTLILNLVQGLRELWEREDPILIVHRDIRPSNIIYVHDDDGERLVLIDWGCATRHNTEVLYAGSRAYAAYRLFAQGLTDGATAQNYHADLADDYGSLLLTAASVFFMPDGVAEACETFGMGGKDMMSMRCRDWLQFWESRLPQHWWIAYTTLAEQQYQDAHASVMQFLNEYLPARPMWS